MRTVLKWLWKGVLLFVLGIVLVAVAKHYDVSGATLSVLVVLGFVCAPFVVLGHRVGKIIRRASA